MKNLLVVVAAAALSAGVLFALPANAQGVSPHTVLISHHVSGCDPTGHCFESTVSVETLLGGFIRGVGSYDCYGANHVIQPCHDVFGTFQLFRDGDFIGSHDVGCGTSGEPVCPNGVFHYDTGSFIDPSGSQSWHSFLDVQATTCCYPQGISQTNSSGLVNH